MGLRRRSGEFAEAGADNINTVTLSFDEAPRNEAYAVVIDRETVQPGAGGWELSLDVYGVQDILRVEDHMVYHDVEVERLPLESSAVPLEWTITDPGALAMRMQFREFDLDGCGAKLELYSAVTDSWTQVTGDDVAANDGWSAWIEGDTIDARVTAPNNCGGFWVPYAQSRAWTMTERFQARTSGETSVTRDGPFGIQAQGGAIVDTEFDRHWFRTITYGAPAGQKQSAIGRRQGNTPPHLCGSPDEIIEYYTEEVCVENRFEVVVPYGEDDCRYSVFDGLDGFEFTGDGGVVRRVDFRGTCAAPVRHGRMTGAQDPTDGFGPVPVPDTDPCVRTEKLVLSPECGRAAAEAYLGDAVADTDCDGLSDFVERCVLGTCWHPNRPCGQQYTAGAHDTDGDGWWDGWEVCGLVELESGDERAVPHELFAGPVVRDVLVEVLVSDDVSEDPRTEIDATFSEIRKNLSQRPPAPFGDWSPLAFSAANIVEFDGASVATRQEAFELYADYVDGSGSQVMGMLWSQPMRQPDEDRVLSHWSNGYSVTGREIQGMYIRPNQFEPHIVTHEIGHSLCLPHGVRDPEGDSSTEERTWSPVYGSVMSYAHTARLEAESKPRFSEGGRSIALESMLSETNVLNTDLYRGQQYSGFWREPTIGPTRSARNPRGGISNDCTLPFSTCPDGYACVEFLPGPIYYNGPVTDEPDSVEPRVGQCRAITPHIDWNGNGRLDQGIVRHEAHGSPETVQGWSSDSDCEVSPFDANDDLRDEQRRTWQLRREAGECEWGSDSPAPSTSDDRPFIFPTAEYCQSDRAERLRGETFSGFEGIEGSFTQTIVESSNSIAPDVFDDRCVWLESDSPLLVNHPYMDRNDFDEMDFRWQADGPQCDGTLHMPDFTPGLGACDYEGFECF